MIVDSLEAFSRYTSVNPLFARVAAYLKENDLSTLTPGIHPIEGEDLYVNIQEAKPKTRQQARFESHRRMIDIQLPISGPEEHGWTPLDDLPQGAYNEAGDIAFHDPEGESSPEALAQTYYRLLPGQFAVYFPSDGHAPGITNTTLRKAIFKVKA